MNLPPFPLEFRPTTSAAALRARADLNALIRAFMNDREILEVETPLLSAAATSDPQIESFVTTTSGPTRWLRTSPEFPMKRLLASGLGAIYELGRVFRAGERSSRHNLEFTLLEWYRPGMSLNALIAELLELVTLCALEFSVPLREPITFSYRALFERYVGLDPFHAPLEEFARINPGFKGELDRDGWQQLTLTHLIEPQFASDQLLVVYDFPASQCALARIRLDPVPVAERFELYWGAIELANGYFELSDCVEQRARFEADLRVRAERGKPCVQYDERLLAALASSLPACAGVAMGVDRLLMKLLGLNALDQVISFPAEIA